ncbi:MAG: Hint domain-containing protein [Methylobacter sp.]
MRTVPMPGGCFAAGTLVQTKEGLKPIEQIKADDWVLSKPENGHGEQAYKRVVRTVQFEDKSVIRVRYGAVSGRGSLIVTGNHPFWVVGYEPDYFPPDWDGPRETGWMRADRLDRGMLVLLANGEIGQLSFVDPIWRTRTEGVGWIDLGRESYAQDTGYLIDLREGKIEENYH